MFGKRPLMWQVELGGRTEIILSFCRNTHTHTHTHTHTPISSCRDRRLAQQTHTLTHTHTHTPISSCRDPRLAQQTHTHTHAHTHPSAAAEAPGWLSGEGPLRDQAVRLSSFYLPYQ